MTTITPDAGTIDVPWARGRNIKLLPLVSELKILTKERGMARLGDVMNYAQRDFLARAERQLHDHGHIRIVVLKARQIGISTIIEAIFFALAMIERDFKTLIVSHEAESSKAILGMTKRYWDTYIFNRFHATIYNGQSHLAWDNGCDINVATAKNVEAGRSQTIHGLHASEVGMWKKADELMTGLSNSIPAFGLTAVFIESTAKGVGNYFHKTCTDAMKGKSEYEFCFYPWHHHPEYTAKYLTPEIRHLYRLENLDEEERRLRHDHGISDERLIWRRWAIVNKCNGSVDNFHQEYPTTPHEAFISTGLNVFRLPNLLAHYRPMKGKRGRLVKSGPGVKFVPDSEGWLTVFAEPSPDKSWGIYLAGGDPTHTTAGDNACIQVINRRTLEQVAVYRRKIDPINFGKDMQLVGRYYNDAFLAPEKEGPGYATVGCIVGDGYPNVYQSQNIAKMQGKPTTDLAGWSTNSATKHLAVSHLQNALSQGLAHVDGKDYGLVIHDRETLIEMRDYVTTGNGQQYENSDGSEYDDGVMALAIAVAVHHIEPPPPAYEHVDATTGRAPVAPVKHAGVSTGSGPAPAPEIVENHVPDPDGWEPEPEAPWEAWGRDDNDNGYDNQQEW